METGKLLRNAAAICKKMRRSERDRCPRSVFELHEQFHTLAGLACWHKLMYVASGRHSDGDSLSPSWQGC